MLRGWLIEDEGRTAEAFRRELVDPAAARRAQREREGHDVRLAGEWVIDRPAGRPALRFAWSAMDKDQDPPGSPAA